MFRVFHQIWAAIRVDGAAAFSYPPPMRKIFLILMTLIAALDWSLQGCDAQMLTPQNSSLEQWVVLKNGELLRGRVTQTEETVIIETSLGNRLVLPLERTDFVCGSLDEAYWGKSARTRASDIQGQKSLFRWCLKHRLIGHAQNQIDLLMLTRIPVGELEFLGRQLGVAIAQENNNNKRSQIANSPPRRETVPAVYPNTHLANHTPRSDSATAPQPVVLDPSIGDFESGLALVDKTIFRPLPFLMTAPNQDALFQSDSLATPPNQTIRQVDFEEELKHETISLDQRIRSSPNPSLSAQPPTRDDRTMIPISELEAEVKSLPKGTFSVFRRKIDGLLVAGCSASKCHDTNSTIMPLMKISRFQQNPTRLSQRNLHNALKYIDQESPSNSPLLTLASTPHAGQKKPAYPIDSRGFEKLMNWLISVSDTPGSDFSNRSLRKPPLASTLDQPAKPLPGRPGFDPLAPTIPRTDPGNPSAASSTTIGEIPDLNPGGSGFSPVDPFDPEIFNRQHQSGTLMPIGAANFTHRND